MPSPPPPPPPGHTCDVAGVQAQWDARQAEHAELMAEVQTFYEGLQGYEHHYCSPTFSGGASCCLSIRELAENVAEFIDAREAEWQAYKAGFVAMIAAVAHPDPPGCVNRLAACVTQVHHAEQHDLVTQQTFEEVYQTNFAQIKQTCGEIP